MNIPFHHPPTNTANPFVDFQPGNILHYPETAGVYIFGLKIIINGIKKFVPLYVGISQNLRIRLWQHYCEEKTGGNSKWYVFDYSSVIKISDVSNLFDSMKIADSYKGLNPKRFSEKLIWFNNKLFFDTKLELKGSSRYISNSGVLSSILPGGDLDQIASNCELIEAFNLKDRIEKSKALFDENFYFIYTSLEDIKIQNNHELYNDYQDYLNNKKYMNGRSNGPGRKLAEKIEHTTKKALNEISIFTCAKSHGTICNASIDLQSVQNNLINLGDHNFNHEAGEYKNPLILKTIKP